MSRRLAVPKTYKLYIGGKFPRSESGRTYELLGAKGDFVANVAKASRKDARDAVVAARGALKGWAGATAYNRGQVLYRIAELLEGRRAQFVDEIVSMEGVTAAAASAQVDEATAGSGTPAGPTSTPRSPATRTRSPARTSTSRCPSRRGSWP
jgi:acyl-CoA reductase-like NAD-dependent aldehyde dehydrogenase